MKGKFSLERKIHLLVCMICGFTGAHTILLREANYGNAQSANVAFIMADIVNAKWMDLIWRCLGLLIYIAGMILALLLIRNKKLPMRPLSLVVEAIGIVIGALLPAEMDVVLALYPFFFSTAFMWMSFNGADGYNIAVIFSTNNFRQTVTGCADYIHTHEKKHLEKAAIYGQSVLALMAGSVIGGAVSRWYGPKGMFFGLFIVAVTFCLVMKEQSVPNREAEKQSKRPAIKTKCSIDRAIHLHMCAIGGFLGTYTLLLRGDNYACAQTGSLVAMMNYVSEGDWIAIGFRIIGAALFAAAMACTVVLSRRKHFPLKSLTLLVEALGIILTAMLPVSSELTTVFSIRVNHILGLLPIFFISAFQWGTFSGADGYACATVFTTNNLRQCVTSWMDYSETREGKHKHRAVFFTHSICGFTAGCLYGSFAAVYFGPIGILFALIPVASAECLVIIQRFLQKRRLRMSADNCN